MTSTEKPATFNYSGAEWDKIDETIRAVRKGPLSQVERSQLLRAAEEYQLGVAERASGSYLSPKERAKLYGKAAKFCGQFRDALRDADVRAGPRGGALIPREVMCMLTRNGNAEINLSTFDDNYLYLDHRDLDALLESVQRNCEKLSTPDMWAVSLRHSFTGRLEPSVVCYQCILLFWEEIGGSLGISKAADDSNNINGPLVRYFLALARPVMGKNLPSLQTIPDIVDRQREFSDWWKAYQRLTGAPETWDEYINLCERRWPRIADYAKVLRACAKGDIRPS